MLALVGRGVENSVEGLVALAGEGVDSRVRGLAGVAEGCAVLVAVFVASYVAVVVDLSVWEGL